jgi:hypothetical protein
MAPGGLQIESSAPCDNKTKGWQSVPYPIRVGDAKAESISLSINDRFGVLTPHKHDRDDAVAHTLEANMLSAIIHTQPGLAQDQETHQAAMRVAIKRERGEV